jgi:hypothetical protein
LGLGREELGVLAVLLLRGPQTPGELKSRSERMAPMASLADVERVLNTLIERGYARRLARRPGQKEDRFEQLLGGGAGGASEVPSSPVDAIAPSPPAPPQDGLAARVEALEAEVARLRAEVETLLGAPDAQVSTSY